MNTDMKQEGRERLRRIRTDLGPRVPHYMRSTKCHYIPLDTVGLNVPDGLVVCAKWGNRVERAYCADGKWFTVWDDKPMPPPEGVQVRRGLYA